MTSARACLVVLCAGFLAGCASRAPQPAAAPAATTDIDALVRQGCYRCLEEAYAASGERGARAFEIAVLLAARAKELGLPPDEWISAATDALATLPPGFRIYFDVVSALPVDPMSGDRDAILTETRIRRIGADVIQTWRAALPAAPGLRLLGAYLDLALACAYQHEQRDEALNRYMAEFGNIPLIAYRAGICTPSEQPRLLAVRDADERFTDADYMLGTYAAADALRPDEGEAMRRFPSAVAAFPASPAIRVRLADLLQAREEWAAALEAYDAVLALVPTHRDALIGRTIALSELGQYAEAITTASRVIDLGTWFIGQAYYWRAWNRYQLGDHTAARADADRAKTMMVNVATLMLSGLIEWRLGRPPSGETEFEEAVRLDRHECDAAMLLGGVRAEQRKWKEGAEAFTEAKRCSERDIQLRTGTIERLKKQGYAPEILARYVAVQQRALDKSQKRLVEAERHAAELLKRAGVPR